MEDSLEKMTDEELSLSKATVDKIIAETLNGKTAVREVKDIIMQSSIEFVHLITAEANELCEKENKKTITHDHIYKAMANLGYGHYIEDCNDVYVEYTSLNKLKPSKTNKFKDSGLSMDELHLQQLVLFEDARNKYVNSTPEKREEKKE